LTTVDGSRFTFKAVWQTCSILTNSILTNSSIVYTVENIDQGDNAGFALNSDGYYESRNKGVANSYALCRVTFNATAGSTVTFSCISYGENNYDYGIMSYLDSELIPIYTVDSSYYKSFCGQSSSSVQQVSYTISTDGEHFIYIKYRKNSSKDEGNDSFQFKMISASNYVFENIDEPNNYGFIYNEEGYYESQNQGVAYSYSLCKISFYATAGSTLTIYFICYSEFSCDYGIFGNLDTELSASCDDDGGYDYTYNYNGTIRSGSVEYSIDEEGEHFIYIKYRKDGSTNYGIDSLIFSFDEGILKTGIVENYVADSDGNYGFALNSDGYYENKNQGVSDSYSLSVIVFYATAGSVFNIYAKFQGEFYNGFGMFGYLDTELSENVDIDGCYAFTYTYYNGSDDYICNAMIKYTIEEDGMHFIYVKYINGTTDSNGLDFLQFKVLGENEYWVENTLESNNYGFQLNDDGYYESQNKQNVYSYSLCKLSFYATSGSTLRISYIWNTDDIDTKYGIFSILDTELSADYYDSEYTGYYRTNNGTPSDSECSFEYNITEDGEHFIYIKYMNAGSITSEWVNYLQFRVEII
jgi:hypothetical protein